ncbi:lytic transglycosylase domain-containing protein [Phaeocystidibacter luteus]|uniref:LysM peptidoglycan-binding domain-containing protein n=1 Tax=Phaeocystidibacter luteus TaxID=911197 RepID=A0A6N6RGV3_9FLAO|nr:lytic transglycosylase domain-containing protein [Phaeocystidibacter luteus]KAB2808715.1 LysM peptidoglycan-binding domain-containing protein [Phaeocystidibacter luteus]
MKAHNPLLIFTVFSMSFSAWAGPGDSTDVSTTDTLANEEWTFEDDPFAARLDSLMNSVLFASETFPELELDSSLYALDSIPQFSDSIMELRMADLNSRTPFDLVYNQEVRRYIDLYANRRREQVSRMLGLAEYYFPMFEETLDKYDMPIELKYLAIVESALNPQARSRVGAKGLWQFMYATGRMQGLRVSSYVDERSDPHKSTEAACDYLTKLYSIFGDWNLALAAYNSGPGNVNKAIRRSGGKRDYWEIRPWLPRETAGYVPAFIAVNYVMSYAPEHGLYPTPSILSYYETDTIRVRHKLNFDQISTVTGVDKEAISILNPSYKTEFIPEISGQNHYLVLPREAMGVFITNEDSIYAMAAAEFEKKEAEEPEHQEMDERLVHRVRSGESLGVIGEKYGVSVGQIKSWNGLRGTTIRVGQRLIIYPRRLPQQETRTATTTTSNGGVRYTVRSGDTLYDIARKYPGVSADNIMEWNNIRSASSLRPGQTLVIHPQ